MARRATKFSSPAYSKTMLMISAAVVLGGFGVAQAEPLVINPFPEKAENAPDMKPDAVIEEPAIEHGEPAVEQEEIVVEEAITPEPPAEPPAEDAWVDVDVAPMSAEVESVAEPMPEPILNSEAPRRALPSGVMVPEPGSDYFAAPGTAPSAPLAASEVMAEPEMTEQMYEQMRAPEEAAEPDYLAPSPIANPPPPPERLKPGRLVDEVPMTVTLEDIGEQPVDLDAPLMDEAPKGPPVPYMVQKSRGYVPQDSELGMEEGEVSPPAEMAPEMAVEPEMPAPPPAPILNDEPPALAEMPAMAEPVSAPSAPHAIPSAAPSAPREGLVYIQNGQIYHEPPVEAQVSASAPEAETIIWNDAPATQAHAGAAAQWSVAQGASIRETLAAWSDQAGVRLIWDNRNEFAVLSPLALSGSYEEAVSALLDQYQNDQVRPLAKLHQEPGSGERVLVVSVMSGS